MERGGGSLPVARINARYYSLGSEAMVAWCMNIEETAGCMSQDGGGETEGGKGWNGCCCRRCMHPLEAENCRPDVKSKPGPESGVRPTPIVHAPFLTPSIIIANENCK